MKTLDDAKKVHEVAAKKVAALQKERAETRAAETTVDRKLERLEALERVTPKDLLEKENLARQARTLEAASDRLKGELATAQKELTEADDDVIRAERAVARGVADESYRLLVSMAEALEEEYGARLAEHEKLLQATGGYRDPFARRGDLSITALERLAAGLKAARAAPHQPATTPAYAQISQRQRVREVTPAEMQLGDMQRLREHNARVVERNARLSERGRTAERSARFSDSNVREVQ